MEEKAEAAINVKEIKIKSNKKKNSSKMYADGISELDSTISSETDFNEQLLCLLKRKKIKHKKQDDIGADVVEIQLNAKGQTDEVDHEIKSNKKKSRSKMYADGISELDSTFTSETDFAEQLLPKRKKKKHKKQDDSEDDVVEIQINANGQTDHEIKSNKKKKRTKMHSDGISQLDSTVNSETHFSEQLSPIKKKHKKSFGEHAIEFIGEQINNREITFDKNENVDFENNVSSSGITESNAVDISNGDENNLNELFPYKMKKCKKQNERMPDKILQIIDEQINIENVNSRTNEIQINPFFENNSELNSSIIILEENNLTEQSTPKTKGKNREKKKKKKKKIKKKIKKKKKIVESEDEDIYKNNEPKYPILSHKIENLRRRKKLLDEQDASDEDELENARNLVIDINWDIPPIHRVTQLVSNEKIEMECKQRLKKGAWSINEELTLVNNWKKFAEEYKIHNPMSLLGLKKQRNKVFEELHLDFVRYLGKDLNNRTLISIYQQARRMFDPHNYKGRMSEIEYKIVKRLVMKYGHKWEKIGRKMNRTGESVRYAWEKLESHDKNFGKWAKEEDDALIEALKHVSGCENLNNLGHHNLPWKKVSEIVKTRDRGQCRLRWLAQLSTEYNEVKTKEWTLDHKIKLLDHLNESDYMCESYIPWEELAADFGLPNCIKMRAKWCAIKSRAPNYYVKTFRENLDWLCLNYLPVLRRLKTSL